MTYRPDVPESPINEDKSRRLPEETDVRTYTRLFLERSLPGREAQDSDTANDSNFRRMALVPSPDERDFRSFNWARTLASAHIEATLEERETASNLLYKDTPVEKYAGHIEWATHDSTRRVQHRRLTINSASDLRYGMRQATDWIVTSHVCQARQLLLDTLQEGGFIFNANEREFVREIELRRAQYPDSQLISLVGETAYKFYRTAYQYTDVDLDTIVLESSDLGQTHIAVFCPEQVRMRQDWVFGYRVDRAPRYWSVNVGVANLMGIDIDPRSLTQDVIRTKSSRRLELE